MYEFSRELFRDLAPAIIQAGDEERDARTRRRVLDACESGMRRMAVEPDLHDPARMVFKNLRAGFHIADLRRVRKLVDAHVMLFYEAKRKGAPVPLEWRDTKCDAYSVKTRKRCRRRPVPGNRYCSYHLYLAEDDRSDQLVASA